MMFAAYYLADIAPDDPSRLAKFVGLYWLAHFALAGVFGHQWLERCETFTVLFTLLAQISLFPNCRIQPPGRNLVHFENANLSLAVLSVSFLAVGSFDGLNETFWWFGKLGINACEVDPVACLEDDLKEQSGIVGGGYFTTGWLFDSVGILLSVGAVGGDQFAVDFGLGLQYHVW